MYDLRFWTFDSDFFEAFPDFQGTGRKFEPQLAVVRLANRTVEHERAMRRANRDERFHQLLQRRYDSIVRLEEVSKLRARGITAENDDQ